jgi:hypothetical protein
MSADPEFDSLAASFGQKLKEPVQRTSRFEDYRVRTKLEALIDELELRPDRPADLLRLLHEAKRTVSNMITSAENSIRFNQGTAEIRHKERWGDGGVDFS